MDREGCRGYDHVRTMTRLSLCKHSDNSDEGGTMERKSFDGEHSDQSEYWRRRRGFGRLGAESEPESDQRGSSLPSSTPPRRRRVASGGCSSDEVYYGEKQYGSENENGKMRRAGKGMKIRRRRDLGEEYGIGSSKSVVMITRPKGGRRSLCMDMEEVRACKDLGFELEHEKVMEILPGQVTLSASPTTNGDTSPIATWHVSNLEDDPRDVKAKLKMWAQAVAIATTSRNGGI